MKANSDEYNSLSKIKNRYYIQYIYLMLRPNY